MSASTTNVAQVSLVLTAQDAEAVYRALCERAARLYHEIMDDLDTIEIGGVPHHDLTERNAMKRERDALREQARRLLVQLDQQEVSQ